MDRNAPRSAPASAPANRPPTAPFGPPARAPVNSPTRAPKTPTRTTPTTSGRTAGSTARFAASPMRLNSSLGRLRPRIERDGEAGQQGERRVPAEARHVQRHEHGGQRHGDQQLRAQEHAPADGPEEPLAGEQHPADRDQQGHEDEAARSPRQQGRSRARSPARPPSISAFARSMWARTKPRRAILTTPSWALRPGGRAGRRALAGTARRGRAGGAGSPGVGGGSRGFGCGLFGIQRSSSAEGVGGPRGTAAMIPAPGVRAPVTRGVHAGPGRTTRTPVSRSRYARGMMDDARRRRPAGSSPRSSSRSAPS